VSGIVDDVTHEREDVDDPKKNRQKKKVVFFLESEKNNVREQSASYFT